MAQAARENRQSNIGVAEMRKNVEFGHPSVTKANFYQGTQRSNNTSEVSSAMQSPIVMNQGNRI